MIFNPPAYGPTPKPLFNFPYLEIPPKVSYPGVERESILSNFKRPPSFPGLELPKIEQFPRVRYPGIEVTLPELPQSNFPRESLSESLTSLLNSRARTGE